MNDDDVRDQLLDNAYAELRRMSVPTTGFTDRVLHELAERGLVRSPRRAAWLIAAAVALFALGLATGAGASTLLSRSHVPQSLRPTLAPSHVESRSEAWF